MLNQHNAFAAGGHNGWHSHPGMVVAGTTGLTAAAFFITAQDACSN